MELKINALYSANDFVTFKKNIYILDKDKYVCTSTSANDGVFASATIRKLISGVINILISACKSPEHVAYRLV